MPPEPPFYLHVFHCHLVAYLLYLSSQLISPSSGQPHSLSNERNYSKFLPFHKAFVLSISYNIWSLNYFIRLLEILYPKWRADMASKIATLESNNTLILTSLPHGTRPIGCK